MSVSECVSVCVFVRLSAIISSELHVTFFLFQQCVGQACKVHETTTLLLVTFQIFTDLKKHSLAHSAINLS